MKETYPSYNIMLLGSRSDGPDLTELSHDKLLRHVGILGNTGSGKTVMAKIILEECALAGIPSIILDLQGDLARMALPTINDRLADSKRQKDWMKKTDVRIWTPLEDSGLPICVNPFNLPSSDLDDDESIKAWDLLAIGLAESLGYPSTNTSHLNVKAFINRLLITLADKNSLPQNFGDLASLIGGEDPADYDDLIKSSLLKELQRNANALNSGIQSRLYTYGTPLKIPMMIETRKKGKTPVNILYLNTLPDEAMKMNFIRQFCRELYDWILQNPSNNGVPQVMFFLDEAGPYIPPDPKMPNSKSIIRQLLKEGRKYGVGCMLASQSPGDLDYRTFGQANTLFLGRFTAQQDIKKIKQILSGMEADRSLADNLPSLEPGQFLLLTSESEGRKVTTMNARRLLTSHGPPIPSKELGSLTSEEQRLWANSMTTKGSSDSIKISNKIRESAIRKSPKANKKEYQDPPVLNGFTHLADNTDPLHVLMSSTNLITAVTLILCSLKLGGLERNGAISELTFIITSLISLAMMVGLIVEYLLKENNELIREIKSKMRPLQYIILFWIWLLWGLNRMNYFDLSEWSFMIRISQTLLTTFFGLEVYHRIKLGKIEINDSSLLNRVKSTLKEIPTILTGAEIEEIRLTSTQIHNQLRTFMEFITVGLLAALVMNIVNLDSEFIASLAISIISLDVALLFSNKVASHKKSKRMN